MAISVSDSQANAVRFSREFISEQLIRVAAYSEILNFVSRQSDDQVFVAGGALRNIYLSTQIKDVDFFLSSDLLSTLLRDHLLTRGKLERGPLGSPRWFPNDTTYFDFVAIETVDHGFGRSKNIIDVLKRFDFTGNALAFQPITGDIIDPFLGSVDLIKRTMRAVRLDFSDARIMPGSALTWRATLWLRLVHYSKTLELRIEPVTMTWLRENRDCEVMAAEFAKIFFEPNIYGTSFE